MSDRSLDDWSIDGRCYACGSTGTGARCACGEPLWLDTRPVPADWPAPDEGSGCWRFARFLPTDPPEGMVAGVGGTPLLRAAALDDYAGCRLHVKDETANPTGSFKDRGTAVGVAAACEAGSEVVGTVSHGNMALSVAALAAGAGLTAVTFVPDDVPPARIANLARFEPEIVPVAGDYGRLYHDSLAVGEEVGVPMLNSDVPLRVAGQKTVVLEILAERTPDSIVLPVSSGGNASAVWKGLRECRRGGLINDDEVPTLHLVQSAACDPIATAYRNGAETVERIDPGETIAYSIANPDPPSGTRALTAARETDGTVSSVSDDAIREAVRQLSTAFGLAVEPSSATALAGLRALCEDGIVETDDEVVLIATGTAFTEGIDADVDVPEAVPRERIGERVAALI